MARVLVFIISGLSIGLPVVAIFLGLFFLSRQGSMTHFYANGGGLKGTPNYFECFPWRHVKRKIGAPVLLTKSG